MPETISAVFTADSAKFQAEAAKVISSISQVEKASARARTVGLPGGVGGLTPQTLQAMERGAALSGELAKKTNQAGQAGKNGSFGFLAFSQAVEDAQYGIKGVLNNIPQMVMGFGGSAGLAGSLSLAAVAAYGAYQAFQKLSGIDAMEKWAADSTKATKIFTEAIKRNKEEMLALDRQEQDQAILNANRVFGEAGIRKNVAVDRSPYEAADDDAARAARQRAAVNAMVSAGSSTAVTGENPDQQAARENQEANRKFLIDQARATEDLAAAQMELNRISADYKKLSADNDAASVRISKDRREAKATEKEALQKLKSLEGELQRARAMATGDEFFDEFNRKQAEAEVLAIEKKVKAQQDWLKTTKEQTAVQDGLLKKLEETVETDRKFLEDRARAARKVIESSKEELSVRKALAEKEAKEAQMRAAQSKSPALQEALDTARRQRDAAAPVLEDLALSRAQRDGVLTPYGARESAKGIQDRREAERRAKENGMSPEENRRMLQEMRENQEWMQRNSGTVKERRQQRTADRQAVRDEQRNERVRSAARQRESRDQNGRQIPDDRIDPNAKSAEADKRVADAQKKVDDNQATQVAIARDIESIKESVTKLSTNLGTL
jgi:hypothetical protein